MTSRERIEATFKHKEPDRTPIFEYILLPPITDYILGRPFIEYLGDMNRWLDMAKENGLEQSVYQYVRDRLDIACKLEQDHFLREYGLRKGFKFGITRKYTQNNY